MLASDRRLETQLFLVVGCVFCISVEGLELILKRKNRSVFVFFFREKVRSSLNHFYTLSRSSGRDFVRRDYSAMGPLLSFSIFGGSGKSSSVSSLSVFPCWPWATIFWASGSVISSGLTCVATLAVGGLTSLFGSWIFGFFAIGGGFIEPDFSGSASATLLLT